MNLLFLIALLICGGYCASKNKKLVNKNFGLVFGLFLFVCVLFPLVGSQKIWEARTQINWNFLILNSIVLSALGLFFYICGFGLMVLAKTIKNRAHCKNEVPKKEPSAGLGHISFITTDDVKSSESGSSTTSPTSQSIKLGVNTPFRRAVLLLFISYFFIGMGCTVYYFIKAKDLKSPEILLFQDEALAFCVKEDIHTNFSNCLNKYRRAPFNLNDEIRNLEIALEVRSWCYRGYGMKYGEWINNLDSLDSVDWWKCQDAMAATRKKVLSHMSLEEARIALTTYKKIRDFDGQWFLAKTDSNFFVNYFIGNIFLLCMLFSFSSGIAQKTISVIQLVFLSLLDLCLRPFRRIGSWIKTGK